VVVAKDEGPKALALDKLRAAKPYFKPEGGTITSLSSSSLNDGAAAVLLTTATKAKDLGLRPLAELKAFGNVGVPRELMGEGAFKVIGPVLRKAGLKIQDVDYFELNEAFAAVVGAAFHDVDGLKPERVKPVGSGISLGHPVARPVRGRWSTWCTSSRGATARSA